MKKEEIITYSKITSFYLKGSIPDYLYIEVSSSGRGIPGVYITGAGRAESINTIRKLRAAFANSGLEFPSKKITVNIRPDRVVKSLSKIEFPLSMGIMFTHILKHPTPEGIFYGSLDSMGHLIPSVETVFLNDLLGVGGIENEHTLRYFVPHGSYYFFNKREKNSEQKIFELKSLSDAVSFFGSGEDLSASPEFRLPDPSFDDYKNADAGFSGILGNETSKRVLTVALAGKHNVLMLGPSGTGKSILARKCGDIYPDPDKCEVTERLKVCAITGSPENSVYSAPFISPHISASESEMLGNPNSSGYITAAHKGILFLDEMHQFPARILSSLKTVVDGREICFNKKGVNVKYPADFLLIGAANNCMCGLLGSEELQCKCSGREINSYNARMNPSFLERFDLLTFVSGSPVAAVSGTHLNSDKGVKSSIEKAAKIQRERYLSYDFITNSRIPYIYINKFCPLEKDASKLLEMVCAKYGLSTRAVHKILMVSRTIADLEEKEIISSAHIAEAVQYRVKNDKP